MGTQGFKHAVGVNHPPGAIILEVGASTDLKRGSTVWLARVGPPVITVDVDPDVIAAVGRLDNVTAVYGPAEKCLLGWEVPISFAWLDGHDWFYSEKPYEYWEAQRAVYESRNQSHAQEASRLAHLQVTEIIADRVVPGGVIAFDDTWRTPNGWNGKGGTAVPYLLDRGYELLCWGDVGQDISTRMVSLRRA